MFFPIIGCFLTLLSPIQSVTPQQQPANSNQFFGAYNFREVNYYQYLTQYYPTSTPEDFNFSKLDAEVYDEIDIYYSTDRTYQQYHEFDIEFSGYNSAFEFSFAIGGGSPKTFLLYYDRPFSEQPQNAQYFTIYFSRYTYLETGVANIFNFFFTKQVNSHHEYYTGFYTFNNNVNGFYQLYGNVSANNVMFNYLSYNYNNDINFYYQQEGLSTISYTLYQSSTWNASRSVYFSSVLIPSDLRLYMEARGVFAYVPQTELSDLQDLFFALADTPIYYLTTWFNFDLLGFNFGIAIISLLSLLLVLFIIKKLTK